MKVFSLLHIWTHLVIEYSRLPYSVFYQLANAHGNQKINQNSLKSIVTKPALGCSLLAKQITLCWSPGFALVWYISRADAECQTSVFKIVYFTTEHWPTDMKTNLIVRRLLTVIHQLFSNVMNCICVYTGYVNMVLQIHNNPFSWPVGN